MQNKIGCTCKGRNLISSVINFFYLFILLEINQKIEVN